MKRTKDTFFEHISTKDYETIDAYQKRIANFEKYCIKKSEEPEIFERLKTDWEDILQLYINWLSKDHAPNTVWNYFASIRKYLHYMGVRITKDDVDESLELPKKIEKEMYPLQLDDIKRILKEMGYADQALFLTQLSSGIRIGELIQLQKKHFVTGKDRILVKIPSRIAKFRRARTTILSKEAGIKITPILKKKNDDDLVFGTCENVHSAQTNKGQILRNKIQLLGLDMRYEETGHYKINTHSFRAYFITKISRHDPNIAKKLAGEKGYLLTYDGLSDDELLEEYLKAEIDLLVYDNSKKELKISERERKQDEKIHEMDAKLDVLMAEKKLAESITEN